MKRLSSKEKEELFKSKQLLLPFLLDLNSKQSHKFECLNPQTSSEVHSKQSGVGGDDASHL